MSGRMASCDDPEVDPEKDDADALRTVALGGGMVALPLPREWTVDLQGFLEASLTVTRLDDACLHIEAASFEDPASIRDNNLEFYLNGPDSPPLDDSELVRDAAGRPDYTRMLRSVGGLMAPLAEGAEPNEAFRQWRRIDVLPPDHVRTVEVRLVLPIVEAGSPAAARVVGFLDEVMGLADFAEHETAADRVAPNAALKSINLWDVIHMRVPADWPSAERNNPDGTGRYKIDDEDPRSRYTLWFDYDQYDYGVAPDGSHANIDVVSVAHTIADKMSAKGKYDNVSADPMPDRPDEAMVRMASRGIEAGEPLRYIHWERIVRIGDRIIQAHIDWVVIRSVENDPDIVALTELLEREARNAVIGIPGAPPWVVPASGG